MNDFNAEENLSRLIAAFRVQFGEELKVWKSDGPAIWFVTDSAPYVQSIGNRRSNWLKRNAQFWNFEYVAPGEFKYEGLVESPPQDTDEEEEDDPEEDHEGHSVDSS